MKKIAILGASGSIGTSTIEVLRRNKDKFKLVAFSVYNNKEALKSILSEFHDVKIVGVKNKKEIESIICAYPNIEFIEGEAGLNAVALSKCDILVSALVGFVGLIPTLNAIKNNTNVALANKETLVAAGEIVMKEVKKHNVQLTPIDSEHSAIFQCLEGSNKPSKIILTASGGPFYKLSKEELNNVTLKDALNHPNWKMGSKITIDSATLFNKAFEVIEARWLFNLKPEQIEVLIHPQSIVHSMVEYKDGAIKAQLGVADMKVAIAYALTCPKRLGNIAESLDFSKYETLTFITPDLERFEPLAIAYEALKQKGTYPTVMNASNEEAVKLFLNGRIGFNDILKIVKETLSASENCKGNLTINKVLKADKWAREYVRRNY